ncbi:MAG TPA: NAD-dependent epimerase [Betaproteobacteria bacterium]|nr:NAD-dependent epimerase [Betaproteobacteria bacterium]
MSIVVVTGSGGLIGSEAVRFFANQGLDVIGVDNDMRRYFFGDNASTAWNQEVLSKSVKNYMHVSADIRDADEMGVLFKKYGNEIKAVVHAAAQPSHDWAAQEPFTDFSVNATGTLTLLEMCRQHCPDTVFLHLSTNKVYGDTPNHLPLIERDTRWELDLSHAYAEHGIDESMSVDNSTHSIFGASKLSGDILVQEYGRYFGLKTAVFRGGCLTGPAHSGAKLHGFLSYLAKCAVHGDAYTVFGYKGKQVRDNIHSYDLVNALWHFFKAPRVGEIYNMGGSRFSNCSMLEAIEICEKHTNRPFIWEYRDDNRIGDHIWWISDVRKFQLHFPEWQYKYSINDIILEICDSVPSRGV